MMNDITTSNDIVRNFHGVIEDMSPPATVVETELFPEDALEFYTLHNLGLLDPKNNKDHAKAYEKFYNAARGGGVVLSRSVSMGENDLF